ncbi:MULTISPECIES: motility protein A [unclassified Sphingomonas]|uniref:motility protein A n=1 Tax=unclassified Sphingomonas TaxID=196159 RepID=UPI0007023C5C|nr:MULTISPECIES: MotA/TolQ/ExbB proton channel family protein [unclassified Sphingomonas]KQM27688.1 biopolymer transporter ExbB [Sphingomonas sp. Leaf9]KQM44028.1 biopolymer transporter ExbB [Sphingomonas sp. Leaf11]
MDASVLAPYADPVAAAFVVGGTVFALLIRTPPGDLGRAIRALAVIGRRPFSAGDGLTQIAALGRIAKNHGVMSLDRSRIADPDIADAIAAIVDGTGPEGVAATLRHRNESRAERHLAAADMWAAIAELAPALGMVGTLVGLVRMFMAMTDPTAIGQAMAIALLSTLYGAVLAALVGMPIAGRLRRLARAEAFERARFEAPLVALARRERPQFREAAE